MAEQLGGQSAHEQQQHIAEKRNVDVPHASRKPGLTLSEAHYRTVVESASGFAIITTDLQGEITGWNPGAEKLLGWSETEAVGEHACMFFTPEDLARGACDKEMNTAAEQGRAEDERWHQRKDGSRFWSSGLMMRFEDEVTGEHIGYLKILRDRTAQHEGRERLGESEARFRNMADQAPVIMWVTDPNGSCTYLNRRWYEFTGQEEGAGEGSGWLDAVHPDDRPIVEQTLVSETAEQRDYRVEFRLRRADGAYRWTIDTAAARFDPAGKFLGYVGSVIDIDERRDAELVLQASTARAETLAAEQSAILGQLAEGVIVTDREGRITFVNDAAARIHGVARLDVEPDKYSDTYHLLTLDRQPYPPLELPLARAVRAGETVTGARWRIKRPDGSEVLAEGSAQPVLDQSGKQIGAVLTLRDETHREAAEQMLRENEARLRALTDNLPSGMVYQIATGQDGSDRKFLYVSQSHEELTGIPADAVLADPTIPYELVLPEYRPAMVEAEADAIRNRAPFDVQVQIRRADGNVRWSRIISAPREQPNGALIWDGIQIDVTDQKHAEEVLRELNQTLEARVTERTADRDRMWRLSTDLMLVAKFDATITALNPAWTNLLGWQDNELLGQRFIDFVHPDDVESTLAEAAKLSGGLTTLHFENRYRHKDGSYRWLSWTAVPDEGLLHAVARDATAEKERAAELEAAQEQLRQAQKMEAVGQLTGGIAHDFNNLLTGVIGSLDMMQRRLAKGETDKISRYATTAMTAANRAAALTHRLLAFARRQPLDPKPVNANRLVTGMEELLRRTIGEAVSLEIVTAGGLWQTKCDPHQLESAILNLAINGRDAMPEGGKLTIETCNARLDDAYAARQREVKPGQYVCICVTDTGAGMTANVITKAFEPFFTTKPIGQGTGLGLSMIYGFTRQSEGYAKIYSEVDKGTTIKLYLPRYYGKSEDAEADRAELTEAHRTDDGEVVLVVEDEAAVRDLVVDVLQELGYRAIEAADGPAGLKLLQSDLKLDLLISDVGLPGFNGRQLADAARTHRPDLKVLFMTGYAENATIASGFLEPGMQMITKPFAIEALATRIRDMIEEG